MRLQDLRDYPTDYDGVLDEHLSSKTLVARRVAALFDDCPDCEGLGRAPQVTHGGLLTKGTWMPCLCCGGAGVVPTKQAMKLAVGETTYEGRVEPFIGWVRLARYLLGGVPEGEG